MFLVESIYELMNEICGKIKFLPDGKSISLTHGGNNTISADKELIKTDFQQKRAYDKIRA